MNPMTRMPLAVVILTACFLLIGARAHADTVTLSAVRDNTMYSEDGTLSNGSGDHLFAGGTKDNIPSEGKLFVRRGLLAFDIAGAIPAGSTVTAHAADASSCAVTTHTAVATGSGGATTAARSLRVAAPNRRQNAEREATSETD